MGVSGNRARVRVFDMIDALHDEGDSAKGRQCLTLMGRASKPLARKAPNPLARKAPKPLARCTPKPLARSTPKQREAQTPLALKAQLPIASTVCRVSDAAHAAACSRKGFCIRCHMHSMASTLEACAVYAGSTWLISGQNHDWGLGCRICANARNALMNPSAGGHLGRFSAFAACTVRPQTLFHTKFEI